MMGVSMRWSLEDGRSVLWSDGVLTGDKEIIDLVDAMREGEPLLVEEGGMGDYLEASIDDYQSAYWTLRVALETFAEGKQKVIAPKYETDLVIDQPQAELPEPTQKKRAEARWVTIMVKARARRFASRSEAGQYAAYVRWSRQQGNEPLAPDEWRSMSQAMGMDRTSTAGDGAGAPARNEKIEEIKNAIADLQEDLKVMANMPLSHLLEENLIQAGSLTEDSYRQWSTEMDAEGRPGDWMAVDSRGANGIAMGIVSSFVPTERSLETLSKVQRVGSMIEAETARRARERGLSDQQHELIALQEQLAKQVGTLDRYEPKAKTIERIPLDQFLLRADQGELPRAKTLIDEYLKVANQQIEYMKIRQEVMAEIVPVGIKIVDPRLLSASRVPLDTESKALYQAALDKMPRMIPDGVAFADTGASFDTLTRTVDLPTKSMIGNRISMTASPARSAETEFFRTLGKRVDVEHMMGAVAAHEFTHASQARNKVVDALTHTFHANRTIGTPATFVGGKDRNAGSFYVGTINPFFKRVNQPKRSFEDLNGEIYDPDQYMVPYAGRRYPHKGGHAPTEVLSVGVEQAYFGNPGLARAGAIDSDYRSFVLGTIAVGASI